MEPCSNIACYSGDVALVDEGLGYRSVTCRACGNRTPGLPDETEALKVWANWWRERPVLVFVDCENIDPVEGTMGEFGAVEFETRATFRGKDGGLETMRSFARWLDEFHNRPTFVSDNPAYDWQGINHAFLKHLQRNPFGHTARRIGDFYAGTCGDFNRSSDWKRLRITPHDHDPVNDAMGNAEAFGFILRGYRGQPLIPRTQPRNREEARDFHYNLWFSNNTKGLAAMRVAGDEYVPGRCAWEVKGDWRFKQCGNRSGHGPDGIFCARHAAKWVVNG